SPIWFCKSSWFSASASPVCRTTPRQLAGVELAGPYGDWRSIRAVPRTDFAVVELVERVGQAGPFIVRGTLRVAAQRMGLQIGIRGGDGRVHGTAAGAIEDVQLCRDQLVREDIRRITPRRRLQDGDGLRLGVGDAADGDAAHRPYVRVILP